MASPSWWRNKCRAVAGIPALALWGVLLASCRTAPAPVAASVPESIPTPVPEPTPQAPLPAVRQADEIVVAGQFFSTGTRIVTWQDAGGFNAYVPPPSPKLALPPENFTARPPASDGTTGLAALQATVDQFVLHYDGCGLSRICFDTLQRRRLSVHFLLDVDGTLYQTLDLQERAFHATIANDRSIGIEIANIGAYPPANAKVLGQWYQRDATGRTRLRLPAGALPGYAGGPARSDPVRDTVQGLALEQYDLTPEQYAALTKLTAALCRVFPKLKCDYPRGTDGRVFPQKLPDAALAKYQGVIGHYHIQTNKIDPGPALQWDLLIDGARALLKQP